MRLIGKFKTGCKHNVALAKASLAAVKVFKVASVHTSSFFCPVGVCHNYHEVVSRLFGNNVGLDDGLEETIP